MLSQLPTGAIISKGAFDTSRDAICMGEAFALNLCVIGFGLADSSFAASVLKNFCGSSKSLLTAAKLARRCG
jgi:hypothetical protein